MHAKRVLAQLFPRALYIWRVKRGKDMAAMLRQRLWPARAEDAKGPYLISRASAVGRYMLE